MSYDTILVEQRERVTLVTLNRPQALNALMVRMIAFPDFHEGVRAMLMDKDNAPRWSPLAPVAPLFEPLPANEAWSPL